MDKIALLKFIGAAMTVGGFLLSAEVQRREIDQAVDTAVAKRDTPSTPE